MNYFAHALPFLDRPYFLAGTCVPDWLTVADRKVRLRSKHVEAFCHEGDGDVPAVAGGILQHLRDDAMFHGSRAFAETSLQVTAAIGQALGGEAGLRPAFLGHVLVELLLDAVLIADAPQRLEEYYRVLESVDRGSVEAAVNHLAPHPTKRLAVFIDLFIRERILRSYLDDDMLLVRLNQVMRRVGLEPLPQAFIAILPDARELVAGQKTALLAGIPA